MKHRNSKFPLKAAFSYSFCMLVVVPMVIVFLVASMVLRHVIRNAALKTISTFQQSVATTLTSDIEVTSLQLSHFIYANDGEFLRIAGEAYESSGSVQRAAIQELESAFTTAMVPSRSILAGHFFMKAGGGVAMKDDLVVTDAALRSAGWYQQALASPNNIVIGGYDTNREQLTSSKQKSRQLILVTAMALDNQTDRSGTIEAVAYFTVSKLGSLLQTSQGNSALGNTILLDDAGQLVYSGFAEDAACKWFVENSKQFIQDGTVSIRADFDGASRSYSVASCSVAGTDWHVVTFVETSVLTREFTTVGLVLAGVVFGLLALFYVFSRYFLDSILMPVQALANDMRRVANNDLTVQLTPTGHKELRTLTETFNQMILSLNNMLALNEEAHRRKHQAEMQALQSQINPHFIVNTLNSIRFMSQMAGFEGIRQMAEALIRIVSCSFRSSTGFYTVQDELDVLDSYLYIMRIRYSDSFEVQYRVEPACTSCILPRLTLQPIVENAITHGLAEADEELGQLAISVWHEADTLCLCVRDNGCGMPPETIQRIFSGDPLREDRSGSVGLQNVIARLHLNYGAKGNMQIKSEVGAYTEVTLRLPWDAVQPKEGDKNDPHTDRG